VVDLSRLDTQTAGYTMEDNCLAFSGTGSPLTTTTHGGLSGLEHGIAGLEHGIAGLGHGHTHGHIAEPIEITGGGGQGSGSSTSGAGAGNGASTDSLRGRAIHMLLYLNC
jgi:hypothetical protein